MAAVEFLMTAASPLRGHLGPLEVLSGCGLVVPDVGGAKVAA